MRSIWLSAWRSRHLLLLVFAIHLLAAGVDPPSQAAGYRLAFSDDFLSLDLGEHDDNSNQVPHTWYEGVWFSKRHAPRGAFSVANSTLSLTWTRGQNQPDSSISTFSSRNPSYHAWRYGYFEVRMKWRPARGAWPAAWLIPVEAARANGPVDSGEIDIFEGQGDPPRSFFGTIHRWHGAERIASSSPNNRFTLPPSTDVSEFHTYGLLWTPERVTWYFDNVALHSEAAYDIFSRQNYFLVIGMQEGANWKEGDLTGVSAQSFTLDVDWVRVWQLNPK